jgi:hypothetical protein
MITSETLCQKFPKAEGIPAEQRLASPIHQSTWLVDGELKTWNGKRKTVLSPVCVRLADGKLQQQRGSPRCDRRRAQVQVHQYPLHLLTTGRHYST